ncbi:16S rRNA (guanine(966)-N(2))-methyltransferase RsmD [Rhodanobacter hydrolyticus]|uniref:Ribosomal RNA small subunit methyltransferase D n=1 Tax=Rhodanobacter hydrolyticus TaxID=2250595 RepID=A0ABW8JCD8_9GAMM
MSGRIRIIGGSLRNSRLDVPELPGLRPTPERVRETLFNWLSPTIEGARVLDLCAGTGALGMEALSRGATSACFVEPEVQASRALRGNLARLKAAGGDVVAMDAQGFLRGAARPFDLVFLDPPFALDLWGALAQGLEQGGWLAESAWVYLESPREVAPTVPRNWLQHREGRAGEVRFALYRRALPLS